MRFIKPQPLLLFYSYFCCRSLEIISAYLDEYDNLNMLRYRNNGIFIIMYLNLDLNLFCVFFSLFFMNSCFKNKKKKERCLTVHFVAKETEKKIAQKFNEFTKYALDFN